MVAPWINLVVAAAPLQLEWSAPTSCHTSERALEEIARLLGHQAQSPEQSPVAAQVRLERVAPSQWRLSIWTQSPLGAGERVVDGDTCEDLSSAAELIIAMAIDPDAV